MCQRNPRKELPGKVQIQRALVDPGGASARVVENFAIPTTESVIERHKNRKATHRVLGLLESPYYAGKAPVDSSCIDLAVAPATRRR